MKKPTNRRSFLQKVLALTSGALVISKTGFTFNKERKVAEPLVSNLKPMGFQWETRDPFLFCVHQEDDFPQGNTQMGPAASLQGRDLGQDFMIKDGWRMYHGRKVPGFPGHPHRGFETITVVRKGMVDHSDSLGASGRYGNGDVQWMTAGEGVLHAEMFPLLKQEEKNPLELFQIWLNLPAKNKMVDPHFKMMWNENLPKQTHTDGNGRKTKVEVVVGRLANDKAPSPPPNSWAAAEENEVAIYNVRMEADAEWTLPKASPGLNRDIYFYEGNELNAEGIKVPHYHKAELKSDAAIRLRSGKDISHFLILQGKPISEPVVQHGPFVMNSKEEIRQAFADYQRTQFGGWPWGNMDPVHPRNRGRFAIHADGREEYRR
ncbi:MAG: pirin family protein [Vicingaceae bacterium]